MLSSPFSECLPFFLERKIRRSSCQELCCVRSRSNDTLCAGTCQSVQGLNSIQDILPCSIFAVDLSPVIRPIRESGSDVKLVLLEVLSAEGAVSQKVHNIVRANTRMIVILFLICRGYSMRKQLDNPVVMMCSQPKSALFAGKI